MSPAAGRARGEGLQVPAICLPQPSPILPWETHEPGSLEEAVGQMTVFGEGQVRGHWENSEWYPKPTTLPFVLHSIDPGWVIKRLTNMERNVSLPEFHIYLYPFSNILSFFPLCG